MTPQENIADLHDDMKYAGFGKVFNPAIEYYVLQGADKFSTQTESFIDPNGHRVEHLLEFAQGTGKDGPRHYYNGMKTTLYMIEIPNVAVNGIDTADLERLLQHRPQYDPVARNGNYGAFETDSQAYLADLTTKLQLLATGNADIFNHLVVKYDVHISFEQPVEWLDAQKKIREQETVTQFFPRKKKITAAEAPNLLYGRAVNKEYYNREGDLYNTWLQLNFSKRTATENYEYKSWHQNHGFDLDAKLGEFNFADFDDRAKKEAVYNLRKGFLVEAVGISNTGEHVALILETNPEKRTLNLYSGGKLQAHNPFRKAPRVQHRSTVVRKQRQRTTPPSGSPESAGPSSPEQAAPPQTSEDASSEKNVNYEQSSHPQNSQRHSQSAAPHVRRVPNKGRGLH